MGLSALDLSPVHDPGAVPAGRNEDAPLALGRSADGDGATEEVMSE
jgi:hypothetical protein